MADTILAAGSSNNYIRLVELIKLENRESPLIAFSDFNKSPDQQLHKVNIEYLNRHPEFVKRIKADLNDRPVRWRLESISHRLMYVPETRKEYTSLFENYCNDVINDILRLTELDNPYTKIQTPGIGKPENSETKGINAFIVHDLAKEYVAVYVFSNEHKKEIAIELRGKISLNEIGSFSSYIYLDQNGSFELSRDHHTIWQNNAANPYTALMTPVEETLHIALRRYTEKAIKDRIESNSVTTIKEMENIVEDWISIEEAIVGGLVYALLPSIIEKHFHGLPESLIESDIETKDGFRKYRHLRRGIKIVEQLGHKKSLKMYQDDPTAFRDLLI